MAFRNLQTKPVITIPNLGQIASAIQELEEERDGLVDDTCAELAAFHAPSECGDIAFKGMNEHYEERRQEIFKKFGVTEAAYVQQIKARCNGKFAYFGRVL